MKAALVTAAGALAVAVFATAVVRPAERAVAQTSMSYGKVYPRKCKNEANKVVACTSKLRAKTQRNKADGSVWGPHWETTSGAQR